LHAEQEWKNNKNVPKTNRKQNRIQKMTEKDPIVESSQTPSKLDRLHQLSELLHPTGVSAGGASSEGQYAGKQ
jgi:hypothetical protein